MNRVVIKLNEHGELDTVACDEDCRVFVFDPSCKSEPVYELTAGKLVGVHEVRAMIGDNKAATLDSDGPWLDTKPALGEV